jgi:peptidoglycan/LPS O-acetylase OafA/YrhL
LIIIDLKTWIASWDQVNQNDWKLGLFVYTFGILILIRAKGPKRNLHGRFDKFYLFLNLLGKSSYMFYLLQEGFGMPFTSMMVHSGMSTWVAITLSVFLVTLLSILFTYYLEDGAIAVIKRMLTRGFQKFN